MHINRLLNQEKKVCLDVSPKSVLKIKIVNLTQLFEAFSLFTLESMKLVRCEIPLVFCGPMNNSFESN